MYFKGPGAALKAHVRLSAPAGSSMTLIELRRAGFIQQHLIRKSSEHCVRAEPLHPPLPGARPHRAKECAQRIYDNYILYV